MHNMVFFHLYHDYDCVDIDWASHGEGDYSIFRVGNRCSSFFMRLMMLF